MIALGPLHIETRQKQSNGQQLHRAKGINCLVVSLCYGNSLDFFNKMIASVQNFSEEYIVLIMWGSLALNSYWFWHRNLFHRCSQNIVPIQVQGQLSRICCRGKI